MIKLDDPIFTDADKARAFLEAQRWPDGPVCPHCGAIDDATGLKGTAHRPGVYQCNSCREQFSVTVGTVFERSKIALNKWLHATFLMTSSKKGISAHQLGRMLGVTYKTAWFMAHRIRAAMAESNPGPMGGEGKTIEVDETYYGKLETPRKRSKYYPPLKKGGKFGSAEKRIILGLVERGGMTRTFHVQTATYAATGCISRLTE